MKRTIYLLTLLLFTVSCKEKNSYTLNGSFNGAPTEDWIYMVKFLDDYANRDSAKIENGKFTFKGTIDVPEVYAFHYRMDKIIGVASGFIEPGELNLKIDLGNWDLNSKISGGKINDEFNSLEATRIEKFMKPMWSLDQKSQTANPEEKNMINDSLQTLSIANVKFELEYVNNHLNSPIALYLLFRNQFSLSSDEKGTILSKLDSSLHNTLIYNTMIADYRNQMEIINQSEEVRQINDIQIFNSSIAGDSLLDKLIEQNPNKVLYIDIWGTWCGPCKKEFPFSKKLYDGIDHGKIQMIYLCIGSPKEEWEQMINSEGLKGQHYLIDDDNLKKFDNENGINIQGIPRYIIVSKDGKIKDKNAPRPSDDNMIELLTQLTD
jgi:thiol-disulfide isomerase/thioredoxin